MGVASLELLLQQQQHQHCPCLRLQPEKSTGSLLTFCFHYRTMTCLGVSGLGTCLAAIGLLYCSGSGMTRYRNHILPKILRSHVCSSLGNAGLMCPSQSLRTVCTLPSMPTISMRWPFLLIRLATAWLQWLRRCMVHRGSGKGSEHLPLSDSSQVGMVMVQWWRTVGQARPPLLGGYGAGIEK